jgi:glycosyltransferase involved in cell wall biosynthesis
MHITMISATPLSVREGSGTYVAAALLARALREVGHEVRELHPERPAGRLGFTVHRFRFNWSLSPRAVADSDVVVGWDMDGYRLAGRLRRPFVAYVHGQLAEEASFERGLVAATMRLQARAEQRSVVRADRVLTVSEIAHLRLVEIYGVPAARTAVVPPPFDGARWHQALTEARGDAMPHPPTVLCVAHLYPRKNVSSLIRAAAALRDRVPDLRVEVVGDGPERRRLARLVRSLGLERIVHLVGHVDYSALAAAYARCSVFCLPSRQEGFGLVFLEAMAAAKPIVACRGTAAEEIVQENVSGLLVSQNDGAALSEALERLLGDDGLRRRLGEAGPRQVAAYAPEVIARRFVDALPA